MKTMMMIYDSTRTQVGCLFQSFYINISACDAGIRLVIVYRQQVVCANGLTVVRAVVSGTKQVHALSPGRLPVHPE